MATSNPFDNKKALTEQELSARWTTSQKTLQAWRQQGKPPKFMKIGRSVRYSLEVIEQYEADAAATSTTVA